MQEKAIQDAIVSYFSVLGLYCLRVNSGLAVNYYTNNFMTQAPKGHPDLLVENREHRLSFVECKTDSGTVSDVQINFLRIQHKAGRPWLIATSLSDVDKWLNDNNYHGSAKFVDNILDESKKFVPSTVGKRGKNNGTSWFELEMWNRKKGN